MGEFYKSKQQCHAKEYLLFPEYLGHHLSLDETALSQDELYTILTNIAAKGKSGSIVAIVSGTSSDKVASILGKMSLNLRKKVQEITLDMAGSMNVIAKRCFPNAVLVTDRFHV